MLVKILGSAAGGGFPQWNCACSNCSGLRAGTLRGKARTQAQVAISSDGRRWFLLGASPDLRTQIEGNAELHPRREAGGDGVRQSPIGGVVLANAEVDHVLGLLLMRELQPVRVHATASVRRILKENNSMFGMLRRIQEQVTWIDFVPGAAFALRDAGGEDSGLLCHALSLGQHYPVYVSAERRAEFNASEASLGLIIKPGLGKESGSGKRLAYMPAVPKIDDVLLKELDCSDVLLFDGTFFSDNELIRIQGSGQTAQQMGHVPVVESLRRLAEVRRPRKIYVHINNTNPMLDEGGAQYRQVREAGWEIAEDGWQFDL